LCIQILVLDRGDEKWLKLDHDGVGNLNTRRFYAMKFLLEESDSKFNNVVWRGKIHKPIPFKHFVAMS